MSDPAFQKMELPSSVIPVADVPMDADAVYLFDFDGVIASGEEDAIYKLTEKAGERDASALCRGSRDKLF